jgi:hypothetical protein
MLPVPQARVYLLTERIAQSDGAGPAIDIGSLRGQLIVVTLGIDRVVEQESLVVSIWGSPDNIDWRTQAIGSFTPKAYCGIHSTLLNLAKHPEIRYIRAGWKMRRWRKGSSGEPMFGFYVFVEPSGSRLSVKPVRSTELAYGKTLVKSAS